MFLVRRVFKVKQGTSRKAAEIITQMGKVYEEAGQRSRSTVYYSGGSVPGPAVSSGPHHQDSGEAKIRESTAGVSRKPSSDGKACGCSSKHLCVLTAWNT